MVIRKLFYTSVLSFKGEQVTNDKFFRWSSRSLVLHCTQFCYYLVHTPIHASGSNMSEPFPAQALLHCASACRDDHYFDLWDSQALTEETAVFWPVHNGRIVIDWLCDNVKNWLKCNVRVWQSPLELPLQQTSPTTKANAIKTALKELLAAKSMLKATAV